MRVEEEEFRVTPDCIKHISDLYRAALGIHLGPMIPGEAQVYEPAGVEARAGRLAEACETILNEVGLGEEVYRARCAVIAETKY